MRLIGALSLIGVVAGSGPALAATCSFNGASGVLTVDIAGDFSTLKVVSGAIQLDGVACGAATTTSTSRIVVTGQDNDNERVTFVGRFAPGRNDTPEVDDPEIEIEVHGFNEVYDWVIVSGNSQGQVWRFTAGGINLNGDLDEDLQLFGADGTVAMKGLGGDDVIDAAAYTGPYELTFFGGPGNDLLIGSAAGDKLRGDDGDDTLRGGAGNDLLDDGPGNDLLRGGGGHDVMWGQGTAADGSDDFRGGAGIDDVSYIGRQSGVYVSIDGIPDDGAPGELDNVHLDVENVTGGRGDDVLIGSSAANSLDGTWGSNEVYGGDGDDWVDGGVGDATTSNMVFGEGGNDHVNGASGDDFLDGGPGNDELVGYSGNDTLDGGGGADLYDGGFGDDVFYNADGQGETVDCGDGIDDAEPDPLDTFIDCEDI